jgi:uncharacterized protein (TIGR02466 family)
MSDVINAFPLTIYRDSVAVEATARSAMIAAILEMAERKSNQTPGSTWTGDLNGFEALHNDDRFADLFGSFSGPLGRYLELLRIDARKVGLYYTRSWGTVSRHGEATQAHSHLQAHISLVHYLRKPPDSSGISFMSNEVPNQFAPNIFNEQMLECGLLKEIQQLNARRIYLNPNQDDVLIFPSKTMHTIVPNNSVEPRISIAVDIVATVKESAGLEYVLPSLETWKLVM